MMCHFPFLRLGAGSESFLAREGSRRPRYIYIYIYIYICMYVCMYRERERKREVLIVFLVSLRINIIITVVSTTAIRRTSASSFCLNYQIS